MFIMNKLTVTSKESIAFVPGLEGIQFKYQQFFKFNNNYYMREFKDHGVSRTSVTSFLCGSYLLPSVNGVVKLNTLKYRLINIRCEFFVLKSYLSIKNY
jgi:hypothetical protein